MTSTLYTYGVLVEEVAEEEERAEEEAKNESQDYCVLDERASGDRRRRGVRLGPETAPSVKGQTMAAVAHPQFGECAGAGVVLPLHNIRDRRLDRNCPRNRFAGRAARSRVRANSLREIPRDENSVQAAGNPLGRLHQTAEAVGAHFVCTHRRSRTMAPERSQCFRHNSHEGGTADEDQVEEGMESPDTLQAAGAAAGKAQVREEGLRGDAVRRLHLEELQVARRSDLSKSPREGDAREVAVAQRRPAREGHRVDREHYRSSVGLERDRRQEHELVRSRHVPYTVCLSESDHADDSRVPIAVDVA